MEGGGVEGKRRGGGEAGRVQAAPPPAAAAAHTMGWSNLSPGARAPVNPGAGYLTLEPETYTLSASSDP